MGMLDRSTQQAPQGAPPGSGPSSTATPQSGQSPTSLEPQGGPEQPEVRFKEMSDKAVKLVYDERFPQLIKMFEKNGAERFTRSMAVAVNTVIATLEEEQGAPMDLEMATVVGVDIFGKLMEDMIGVVEGVTLEDAQPAMIETMNMFADSHEGVTRQDVAAVMNEVHQGVQQVQGAAAPGTGGPTRHHNHPAQPGRRLHKHRVPQARHPH